MAQYYGTTDFVSAAVRSKAEAVERHALDSLALLPVLEPTQPPAQALRLIDVGSGGGLPGMVLAIARPGWQVGFEFGWVCLHYAVQQIPSPAGHPA